MCNSKSCDNCFPPALLDPDTEGRLTYNATRVNPDYVWLELYWALDGNANVSHGLPEGTSVVSEYLNGTVVLANCTLGFCDLTLDYYNGSYTLVDEELCDTGLSDGLLGPIVLGQYTTQLISDIQGRVFSDNNSDSVMAFLNQDLARLAIWSSVIITDLVTDTLSQGAIGQIIMGRYPFWPTILLIALLYIYAAVAFVIFLWTAMLSRSNNISLSYDDQGKSVSELELAHLRLNSHLAFVSALFPSDVSQRADLSVRLDALDMFEETASPARPISRVRVGLHEDSDSTTVFGVWRRQNMSSRDGEVSKIEI